MQCTSPRTVGFQADGKTLCWSPKKYSKEFAPFQIPCGKCISCRLENARQTAVRCVHEAQQFDQNMFITLTYSDENLKSTKLMYRDFQLFVKKLRDHILHEKLKEIYGKDSTYKQRIENLKTMDKDAKNELYEKIRIGIFCTGEYGDKNKRPHWHAIVFNYSFKDVKRYRENDRGDVLYTSQTLENLWGQNNSEQRPNEIGAVTIDSAGYVARYATKKLYHGKDGTHDFNPISRRSCKYAIGKRWIEKHYEHVFNVGYITFRNNKGDILKCGIPRYYEKWLKKNKPEMWTKYVTGLKCKIIKDALEKESKITLEEKKENLLKRSLEGLKMIPSRTRKQAKAIILEQKFNDNKKNLKL